MSPSRSFRGTLAALALSAIASIATHATARADPALDCGALVAGAVVSAVSQGAQPAQSADFEAHRLPWTNDFVQQAGQSTAHKAVEADCQISGNSMLVSLSAREWGTIAANRPNDAARAGWSPSWTTEVRLPPNKRLNISVASSVNYLSCELVAPGVAATWNRKYADNLTTLSGAGAFTVSLNCTSGGLHDIFQKSEQGWTNDESILIELTVTNPSG